MNTVILKSIAGVFFLCFLLEIIASPRRCFRKIGDPTKTGGKAK
jgi:hypothetical protein